MAIDRELLDNAREAAAAIETAERRVREAQEHYRVAVRRLHVAGVPLREIALLLHLSHQRVHQLVAGTNGPRRRWKIKKSPSTNLACTFCLRHSTRVGKLVAGPDVLICDQCVNGTARFDPVHRKSTLQCSFCGKARPKVARMFATADAQICDECLQVADHIIAGS